MSVYLNIKCRFIYHMLFTSKQIILPTIQNRYLYNVQHNRNRHIFYIKLEKNAERAVLLYKKYNDVLDIQSITVPQKYRQQGIGRLLAETAITYAVLNNYRLILTCVFMQKFYISVKNADLEQRVIGPPNILS